jgi:two-component system response regulator NreC
MTPPATHRVRVLVADDHAVLRAGLRLLIDSQPDMIVVGEASDGPEAVGKTRDARPEVVVLDLVMPRTRPSAIIPQITRLGAHVVVLTMHDDRGYVDAALAAGAQGYVIKKAADTELLAAIRAVSRGRQFVDVRSRGPGPRPGGRRRTGLSPREEGVVRLIGYGHTNREIATSLGVSVKTVETFRARAYQKLGLETRSEMVRYALQMHLVDPQDLAPETSRRSVDRRTKPRRAP